MEFMGERSRHHLGRAIFRHKVLVHELKEGWVFR